MAYSLSELIELAAHTAPADPLTPGQAHEIMRLHRECSARHCPRKSAAFEVLIAARHIVPDSGRHR